MKTKKVTISVFQMLIFLLIVAIIAVAIILIALNIKNNKSQTQIANQTDEINSEQSSGETSNLFKGLGTKDNPYLITNSNQMASLSNSVNEGKNYSNLYFKLENDVNLDENFTPIGGTTIANNVVTNFAGTFDGNDKKINTKTYYLFGNNSGTISNINLNIDLDVQQIDGEELKISALCLENSGNIENCKVEGTIITSQIDTNENSFVSAVVGQNFGKINDTSSLVNITSNMQKAGICITNNGTLDNCTNSGIIKEETATKNYTCGIVNKNEGTLTNCTNSGVITAYKAVRPCREFYGKYNFVSKYRRNFKYRR
mgnify:CR=1 FL=1